MIEKREGNRKLHEDSLMRRSFLKLALSLGNKNEISAAKKRNMRSNKSSKRSDGDIADIQ